MKNTAAGRWEYWSTSETLALVGVHLQKTMSIDSTPFEKPAEIRQINVNDTHKIKDPGDKPGSKDAV